MSGIARSSAFSRLEAWVSFLLAAILTTVTGLRQSGAVWNGELINPDSYMRLDRLRDILASGSPLHVVVRDASGDGAVMSWSHLLDGVLLLLALPFRPFMDGPAALHASAVALGPIEAGLLGIAVAWVLAPLTDRAWRWTAPALAGLAPPIVTFAVPGVAHHHVLVAFVAVMLAGIAGRAVRGDAGLGWKLGGWSAVGIWLTPETMPFVLMAFAAVGVAWMLAPHDRRVGTILATGGTVFLLLTVSLLLADPPMPGYRSAEIDRLSIVYVVLAAVACAIGWQLRMIGRFGLPPRVSRGIAAGSAALGLALWLLMFPAVLKGPDGLMDAASARAFFGDIQEMQPVTSSVEAVEFLIDGGLAAAVVVWFAWTRRSVLWGYAALCVGVVMILGLAHMRFSIYATTAAVLLLPLALTETTRLLAVRPPTQQALARVGLIALMLMTTRAAAFVGVLGLSAAPSPGSAAERPSPGSAAERPRQAAAVSPASCRVSGLGEMLAPYAGQVVIADVNDGPELIYRSGIIVVGSLYHRNITGFLRLRAAWLSAPSDTVPPEVRATRATFVLACRGGSGGSDALFDRLGRGEVPRWLREVALDAPSGNVLYAIVGPAS